MYIYNICQTQYMRDNVKLLLWVYNNSLASQYFCQIISLANIDDTAYKIFKYPHGCDTRDNDFLKQLPDFPNTI